MFQSHLGGETRLAGLGADLNPLDIISQQVTAAANKPATATSWLSTDQVTNLVGAGTSALSSVIGNALGIPTPSVTSVPSAGVTSLPVGTPTYAPTSAPSVAGSPKTLLLIGGAVAAAVVGYVMLSGGKGKKARRSTRRRR